MRETLIKVLTRVVWAVVAGCVAGALGGWVVAQFLHVPQVDVLKDFRPAATTEVYAADGSLLASFARERRVELRPSEIPDHLKLAIVAAEDAKFYEHGGVDPKAILRAVIGSLRTGRLGGQGGGSTLTQQLALNLFLERERKLSRKAKEALLAIDIEKRYSKDQIIAMYANQIFLGHGAYGVEAASRLYFDKSARELTVAEAALLAGMIPSANNKFDPIRRPDGATARRDKVLRRMLELEFIDQATCTAALAEPLGAELHRDRVTTGAYFLEMVRQDIEQSRGTNALYEQGLKVHLTMDPQLQQLAEDAVREGLVALDTERLGFRKPVNVVEEGEAESLESYVHPSWRQLQLTPGAMVHGVVTAVSRRQVELRIAEHAASFDLAAAEWTGLSSLSAAFAPGDLVLVRLPEELPTEDVDVPLQVKLLQEPEIEGALLAMDNHTGAVLAMVGGFDFERSEFNRAVQSKLQCGSAFKPFVYLTAFQQGFTPGDRIFDAPILLADASGQLNYCPKNYYDRYYGITTLRRALELSFNASAVKLQAMVGGEAVVDTARRFGITTELHPYASLALGTLGVRLVDLVRAYSGFANLGEVPEPHFVTAVYDRDGRLEERVFPRVERVMPASVTYLLLNVLKGVVERGTGISARTLGAQLAGKTGTTDDYSDAWFVGFSPRITVGVWVGRDHKAPIGKKMTGAVAAQPLWNRFMASYLETLTEDERAEDFSVPAGVVFSPVDWYTGLAAVPSCSDESRVVLESFLDGTEPSEACDTSLHGLDEVPWPFQEAWYQPRPGEPMPTFDAIAAADDRLKPAPTPEEAAALAAAERAAAMAAGGASP